MNLEQKIIIKLMNKSKILLIALAGMLAAACATDTVDQPVVSGSDSVVAQKLVNNSTDAAQGELVLYVDKASVGQLVEAKSVLNTGVGEFDAVASELGATSVKPVFNMSVNADRKKALGLDRWFVVNFPEDVDVDVAAQKFASVGAVQRIQFATKLQAPKLEAHPVKSVAAATRAAAENYFNDPRLPEQWHYKNIGYKAMVEINKENPDFVVLDIANAGEDINVEPAWDLTTGNKDIIVAVLDEGVDFTHEDLAANMWVNAKEVAGDGVDNDGNGFIDDVYGYNFVDDGALSFDKEGDTGHGTHVAGTVAAVNNNGIGVSGVAGGSGNGDGVRIMSCQIFSGDDNKITSTAQAAEYAADNGAVILQNSWGLPVGTIANDNGFKRGSHSLEYDAFEYFASTKNHPAVDGGVIIFAAGNEGYPSASYPGAYNEYISVTSIAADGLPAYYTNYGPGCNVAAPGGEYARNEYNHLINEGCVLSTLPTSLYPEGYGFMQGSSMACPHVSGIAALALSYASDLGKTFTLDQFKTILLTSVRDINRYLHSEQERTSPMSLKKYTLEGYNNQMGTGIIDTFQVLMSVRGTSCAPVAVGEETVLDVRQFFANGDVTLTILQDIIIPDDVRKRLGIINETIFGNNLIFTCEKPGAGVITVVMVAGGDTVGGGSTTGGMRIEKEIAIVAREDYELDENGKVTNPGGWL